MPTTEFKLSPISVGSDPDDWATVQSILGSADIPVEPDASFRKYSAVMSSLGGLRIGQGFPVVSWNFDALNGVQRYALRQICPGPSARVYFSTLSSDVDEDGERIWVDAAGVMNWPEGDEELEGNTTLDLEIIFTQVEIL